MKRRDFVTSGLAAALSSGPLLSDDEGGALTGQFVHCVYFWLRDDLTADQQRIFREGLASLSAIENVQSGYIGAPAATDREIIDRSYSYALILVFENPEAHDAYQVDAVHEAFRQNTVGFWSDIKIYDVLVP